MFKEQIILSDGASRILMDRFCSSQATCYGYNRHSYGFETCIKD